MVVGFNNLTPDEQKTHFTLWAAIKSPLIMGHDVTKQSATTLKILTNKNIIDLNQGAWSIATRTYSKGNIQLWQQRSTKNADGVVIIINLGAGDQPVAIPLAQIFFDDEEHQMGTYSVTELWTNVVTESVSGQIVVTVKTHGIWVGKFSPTAAVRRSYVQNMDNKRGY
ncbi:Alpha-galactosidase [Arthrobotrys entomopaga]|nr:Alpha-galactosidase [Arthrobotrys entomopaga]